MFKEGAEGKEADESEEGQIVKHEKYIVRPYLFFLAITCIMYHPWNVLTRRIMFSGHESRTMLADATANRNMKRAAQTIWRERGIRGFYAGFAPASVAFLLVLHAEVYNRMTGY